LKIIDRTNFVIYDLLEKSFLYISHFNNLYVKFSLRLVLRMECCSLIIFTGHFVIVPLTWPCLLFVSATSVSLNNTTTKKKNQHQSNAGNTSSDAASDTVICIIITWALNSYVMHKYSSYCRFILKQRSHSCMW